jgi:similar to stage IV sporulation protein
MFMFKLISYLLGYVVILVTGEAPEKFVNMAAGRGIFLWDVFRSGDRAITMKVRLNAVKPLRHIARRTRCRFRICQRRGVPFHAVWLRRRKALALGAVIFLTALYFLSTFVWFVEVRGNEQLDTFEVLEAAEEAGLYRGVFKRSIEAGRVEAKIQEKLPLVSWTGVYIQGTRVIIEVAERTVPGEEERRTSHIVAAKEGMVKEVLVFDGYPVVKEGDTVEQGQVLISGEIPPYAEEPAPGGKRTDDESEGDRQPRYVHAKGIVRARVWYEGYGEAGTVETGRRPTGRSASWVSMDFEGKEIILSGSPDIPFENYKVETFVKKIPDWRNLNMPVEIITVKYIEMDDYRLERSREDAIKLAGERAREAAAKLLPENIEVREQWLEDVTSGNAGDPVRIRAVMETIEDIGRDKFFTP